MKYKMPFQEECATCPYWGDWDGECDFYGWCPTRERAEQDQEAEESFIRIQVGRYESNNEISWE